MTWWRRVAATVAGVDLNGLFDRLPRVTIDVGRRVPTFRSLGIIGFHLAVLAAVLVALRTAVPLVVALGVCAVAGLSFFGWGILRRAVTGYESLVLIEYVWVAYGAVAAFAWALGGSIVAALDVYSVALFPFLACGRIGCLLVGCCHGAPATIGIRYGAEHHVPARLVGCRLFPVQLLEALMLLVLGAISIAVVTIAPGTATVWFLVSYAVVRFGCERLRGDVRPWFLRLPVAQLMCVAQVGAAIAAAEAWLVPRPSSRAFFVGGVVLGAAALAGLGLLAARPRNPLVAAAHLDEAWAIIEAAGLPSGATPVTAATSAGMLVAVGAAPRGRHVSLSHPRHPTMPVALLLGGSATSQVRGITHFVLRRGDDRPSTVPPVEPGPPVADGVRRNGDHLLSQPAGYFERTG